MESFCVKKNHYCPLWPLDDSNIVSHVVNVIDVCENAIDVFWKVTKVKFVHEFFLIQVINAIKFVEVARFIWWFYLLSVKISGNSKL